MKIKYNIDNDGKGWIIVRTLVMRDFRSVDYYTGSDAPYGPYLFGSIVNIKHFRSGSKAQSALDEFMEYKSKINPKGG